MAIVEGAEFLQEARFRGARFLFVSSSTTVGRKNAVKQFIDTDRQAVDDFGKKQRSYSMRGYIARVNEESNYIQLRDVLIKALEAEGPGTLIHPMYGILNNMAVTDASIDETITSLGIGELSLTFTVDGEEADRPTQAAPTANAVSAANNSVLDAAGDSIEDNYSLRTELIGVYDQVVDNLRSAGEAWDEATTFATGIPEKVTELADAISTFKDGFVNLATSPADIIRSFKDVHIAIENTIATAGGTFDVYRSLFSFGGSSSVSTDTVADAVANQNTLALEGAVLAGSLSGAYLAASRKDYKTVDEIDIDIDILEAQMDAIRDIDGFDPGTIVALQEAKEAALSVLDGKKQNAATIIEVGIPLTSYRLLSYTYYGNDSEASDIASLNSTDGIVMNDSAKIFTV